MHCTMGIVHIIYLFYTLGLLIKISQNRHLVGGGEILLAVTVCSLEYLGAMHTAMTTRNLYLGPTTPNT